MPRAQERWEQAQFLLALNLSGEGAWLGSPRAGGLQMEGSGQK